MAGNNKGIIVQIRGKGHVKALPGAMFFGANPAGRLSVGSVKRANRVSHVVCPDWRPLQMTFHKPTEAGTHPPTVRSFDPEEPLIKELNCALILFINKGFVKGFAEQEAKRVQA